MEKKYRYAIVIVLGLIFLAGVAEVASFFFFKAKISTLTLSTNNPLPVSRNQAPPTKTVSPKNTNNVFVVSGWVPYWAKMAGVPSVDNNLDHFSEIYPFAYGVASDGSLIDKMQINVAPWPELFSQVRRKNIKIIPTILWTDAAAMHQTFASSNLAEKNITAIANMLTENNFAGVDIDYEGKNIADRDNFSLFLKSLHEKLQPLGKTVECAAEARTENQPPAGFAGTRAMSWANDFSALDKYCDTVQLMAYDQILQTERATTFDLAGQEPNAPNAGADWVKNVIEYSLRYISPQKLMLGIPTYGWEFKIAKTDGGWRYTEFKSLDYSQALAEAEAAHVTPERTGGGELNFTFQAADGEHLVTFEDAQSISGKINLAKNFHLAGVSFFKLDGGLPAGFYQAIN
jgi:spore germination protein YaaH